MTKYGELSPWLTSMKILSQKNVHKLNYIIVNFTQNNEVSVYIKNKKNHCVSKLNTKWLRRTKWNNWRLYSIAVGQLCKNYSAEFSKGHHKRVMKEEREHFNNQNWITEPRNLLAWPCHPDKKWLKIHQNLIQFLITQLGTKNSFYAAAKTSRPYIMQWVDAGEQPLFIPDQWVL